MNFLQKLDFDNALALARQLVDYCESAGIDPQEVIKIAQLNPDAGIPEPEDWNAINEASIRAQFGDDL